MRKTQKSEILKYMETHKSGITSLQAIEMFGATRLSGIIHDMRKRDGLNIITEIKNVKNRYGGVSSIAVYKLV